MGLDMGDRSGGEWCYAGRATWQALAEAPRVGGVDLLSLELKGVASGIWL